MSDLEKSKGKRKAIRTATTKLLNSIEELFKEIDSVCLDTLNEKLMLILDKENALNEINKEIETLLPAKDIESDVTTSIEYNENICLWKQRIKIQIGKLKGPEVIELKHAINEITVKLPKLNIRPFYGDSAHWLEFYGQFESAIDKNPNLTKIDKLNYLKSYLNGQAASSIAGLAITEQNYDAALNILKTRFGNTNTLIQTHMNGLLKIPAVHNSQDTIGLRKLFDRIENQIRNLEALGVQKETFSSLLAPIILDRIPKDLVLEFNRKYPISYTFQDIHNYLENEIQSREKTYLAPAKPDSFKIKYESNNNNEYKSNFRKFNNRRFDQTRPIAIGNYVSNVKKNCVFCDSTEHEFCEYKTVEDRKNKLKSENRCFKCFSKAHYSRSCRLKIECKYCKSKFHNYILCSKNNVQNETPNVDNSNTESDSSVILQCNSSVSKSKILLLTCSVIVSPINESKNVKIARLLMDNGSERSWCTRSLANFLKLKPIRKERLSVYCFGSERAKEKIYDVVKLKLTSRTDSQQFIEIETLITDTITAAPVAIPDVEIQDVLKSNGIVLADQCEKTDESISVLIGGDMFWNIIENCGFQKINKTLTCVPTIFGYTLQGCQQSDNKSSCVNIVSANLSLGTDVQVLWDLESLGIKDKEELSITEKCFIEQFENNLKFNDGRYETRLLWKDSPVALQNNFTLAKRRFDDLRKCFDKNEWIANEYKEIINDQMGKEIIEECGRDNIEYFMPHRAVVNTNKETTKVRVVYNCSSKSKENLSLNDCLETCPNLNPNVLDIILNFRKFKIAFNGDIEKAFLMIKIAEEDRKFLKFLWFADNNETDYKIMHMNRLPFGCKISSFILSGTIKNHIRKYEMTKPRSVHMLNTSLYVDDLFYGAQNIHDAYNLSHDAVSILREGGFNLRKLRSNSSDLEKLWEQNGLNVGIKGHLKVLGLNWNPEDDVLSLEVRLLIDSLGAIKNTKRGVLRVAAMIFDPIGVAAPFIVRIKRLLQQIWERGISWDQELPDELKEKWLAWCSEIEGLEELKIGRNCLLGHNKDKVTGIELHVFCDASPIAYGAVAYFRYQDDFGKNNVSFVMSKNRVAPLKKLTLPRLELMAVLIGARIGKYICNIFQDLITKTMYWSDSEIALHWVKGCAKRWKQFVSNRVMEIQEKTDPNCWFYCRSEDNPADLVTRGVSVVNLINNEKWFYGPHWLQESEENWPKQLKGKQVDKSSIEIEEKAILVTSMVVKSNVVEELWSKFSSWNKLLRVVAWCLRFVGNCKKLRVLTPYLEVKELEKAHNVIIRSVQSNEFYNEIEQLKGQKCLQPSNKLSQLSLFLDNEGLIRIGGRIKHSNLSVTVKHPILLPKDHLVTKLLITYFHLKYLHCGLQLTHSFLRQKYWIIRARVTIRQIIRSCVICIRHRAELSKQMMADLPCSRVNPGKPFSKTGTDYAGPFSVSARRGRGVRPTKIYVCIFVCFITKAVHLECVYDLTAYSFISTLKRFIARRGKPEELYSDCGKNYIGSRHILNAWVSQDVGQYLANEGIKWRTNPPSAPHFGGLWEAAVKTMKYHMRRVIGQQILSYEEFNTYLTEIEAVMNSRPLIPVSDDPSDLSALTPGHFLIGTELKALPEPDIQSEKITLRERYKLNTQLSQSFWKRWQKDYLTQLQSRNKWRKDYRTMQMNDLVIIKEENLPPLKWKMGRILQVYPGSDDRVRVVKLRTALGEITRPIHKLVLLMSENSKE